MRKRTPLSKEENEQLVNLKKRLPFKFRQKVLEKLPQYASYTITAVLTGDRKNEEILEALIEVAEEHEKKQKDLAERMAIKTT